MRILKIASLVIVLLVIAFIYLEDSPAERNTALEKKLAGEWRNVSLQLTMNSFNNNDTVQIFKVNEGEWEEKMKIQPIRTFYKSDGTYNSEHRNLEDSIIYNPAGIWMITGDTLIMQDTFPEKGLVYKYKVFLDMDKVIFQGKEDCDNDGKADDDYYGIQLRQSL